VKTINIGETMPSLPELLALASDGNVILCAPDGKEFLLAEVDDLALEVATISQQPELMEFLAKRSKGSPRYSLQQVRETLGLARGA
jgi:hypothetical protein